MAKNNQPPAVNHTESVLRATFAISAWRAAISGDVPSGINASTAASLRRFNQFTISPQQTIAGRWVVFEGD
jgi:hypothetical protein